VRVDLLAPAIVQLDFWIAAHGADFRIPGALNERCRLKALSGQDLSRALDDCNAALRRVDKGDARSAHFLDSRGLVRLRLGDYDKSIADYDAALVALPKDAWALYGRGIDKVRRGKVTEGNADLAAAMALSPRIANAFDKHGIGP
jgi:tetratricopeptide (TPR) repeat protein